MTSVDHSRHGLGCIITQTVKDGAPVTEVHWNPPISSADSGFTCWSDADPEVVDEDRLMVMCAHCLIDEHPEAGALMDHARLDGVALASGPDR
jgi:hypothetical protein